MCLQLFHEMTTIHTNPSGVTEADFYGIFGSATERIFQFHLHAHIFPDQKNGAPRCELNLVDTINLPKAGVNALCLRPDGKIWVSAGWDHRIRLFSTQTSKLLGVVHLHTADMADVIFANYDREGNSSSPTTLISTATPVNPAGRTIFTPLQNHRDVLVCAGRDGLISVYSLDVV